MADLYGGEGEAVKVVARVRPLNAVEMERGPAVAVEVLGTEQLRLDAEGKRSTFQFDQVFPMHSTQEEVYEQVAAPMVSGALDGINSCILAYGQTGSGKTHTITGRTNSAQHKGLVPRMFEDLFAALLSSKARFDLRLSYVEIYKEVVYDLIMPTTGSLDMYEDKDRGIFITGATEVPVRSLTEAMEVVDRGAANRRVAETRMNRESSRSHAVLIVSIARQNPDTQTIRFSQLYICDLAGSENAFKTKVEGEQLVEAGHINASLLTLGRVIRALSSKTASHVPYRDSKLTRLLCTSLGGNSRTALVITLSPSEWNASESLSTLRFGNATRLIENKPIANEVVQDEQLEVHLALAQKKLVQNRAVLARLHREREQLAALLTALGVTAAQIEAAELEALGGGRATVARPSTAAESFEGTGSPGDLGGAAESKEGGKFDEEAEGKQAAAAVGAEGDMPPRPDTRQEAALHASERSSMRSLAGMGSTMYLHEAGEE